MDAGRAARIRRMRVIAGLNQTDVAAGIDVSRQEYSLVEAGKIEASDQTYEQIEDTILTLARKRVQLLESLQAISALKISCPVSAGLAGEMEEKPRAMLSLHNASPSTLPGNEQGR